MSIFDSREIKIDLKEDRALINEECKQNDTLTFFFDVYDNYASANLDGLSCLLVANKGGKYYEIRDVDIIITGNKVKVKCPNSITQIAGILRLELWFLDNTNSLKKSSFDIKIKIKPSVLADSNGNVGETIVTPLQNLDSKLIELTGKIAEAKAANNTLTNTTGDAKNTNSALISNTAKAESTNSTIVTNTTEAKTTIDELKKTNSAYTDHINNVDIHVTKTQKDKWDAYEAKIQELTTIIDDVLYKDAVVVDDEGNTIIDDEENTIIV